MVPTSIDAKKVIAEAAREHGVLLEEGDPLFVALAAHVVVLQEVGDRLLTAIVFEFPFPPRSNPHCEVR